SAGSCAACSATAPRPGRRKRCAARWAASSRKRSAARCRRSWRGCPSTPRCPTTSWPSSRRWSRNCSPGARRGEMNGLGHFADALLTRLAWTSIQATVLIAVVLLIVRLLPRLPAAVRCTLWWLVSLQLLLGLCWHAPLALPLLGPVATVASNTSIEHPAVDLAGATTMPTVTRNASVPYHEESPADNAATGFIHWRELLPLLWLAAMLAQLPLLTRQWLRMRRLLGTAEPLADPALQALCAQRASALGLRRCPPLYVCVDIDSPQVNGLRQPVVLLPAVHAMTPAESAMAIAHELAHLRRGDLWLGWLPAIA